MEMIQKLQGHPEEVEEVASEVAVADLVQEVQVSSGLQMVCFIKEEMIKWLNWGI